MKIEEARALTKQANERTYNDLIQGTFRQIYGIIKENAERGNHQCFVSVMPSDHIPDVSERLVKEGYTIEKYANGVKIIWA